MKINYIKEEYFRNLRKEKENGVKQVSDDELIDRAILNSTRVNISTKFKEIETEVREMIAGRVNSILCKSDNEISITDIQHDVENGYIECTIILNVKRSGTFMNSGDAHLLLAYPENLKELESVMTEQYGYNTKIYLKFVEDENSHGYAKEFFAKPTYIHNSRVVSLYATDCVDLTDFCYLLNSIKGIDFSYWSLSISNFINGMELKTTRTTIPLNQKFSLVSLKDFFPNEIDLRGILSEKLTPQYFTGRLTDNGRDESQHILDNEHITGIVSVLVPLQRGEGTVEEFLEFITDFQNIAAQMTEYSNVYFRVVFPHYVQYQSNRATRQQLKSIFNELEWYLEDNYKKAKENNFDIEDPLNMTLSFKFDGDDYSTIGIFPYINHYDIGLYKNTVLRNKK